MAKAPPPKRTTKGEPPSADKAPGNLDRPDYSGVKKNLNFTVPEEFLREYKIYAIEQGKSMIEIFYESVELHKATYGK